MMPCLLKIYIFTKPNVTFNIGSTKYTTDICENTNGKHKYIYRVLIKHLDKITDRMG